MAVRAKRAAIICGLGLVALAPAVHARSGNPTSLAYARWQEFETGVPDAFGSTGAVADARYDPGSVRRYGRKIRLRYGVRTYGSGVVYVIIVERVEIDCARRESRILWTNDLSRRNSGPEPARPLADANWRHSELADRFCPGG